MDTSFLGAFFEIVEDGTRYLARHECGAPIRRNTLERLRSLIDETERYLDAYTAKEIEELTQDLDTKWCENMYPPDEEMKRVERNTKGYVYLIRSGDAYKIGLSADPDRRAYTEISPIMPYRTELLHVIMSDDMYTFERELHEQFADKRLNGEWFALTPADVNYIKSL